MELVRERSDALRHLMELGLVFLDYTVSVWAAGDYDVYYRSKLYEMFCHTVMEGAKRDDFLFDLAVFAQRPRLSDEPRRGSPQALLIKKPPPDVGAAFTGLAPVICLSFPAEKRPCALPCCGSG